MGSQIPEKPWDGKTERRSDVRCAFEAAEDGQKSPKEVTSGIYQRLQKVLTKGAPPRELALDFSRKAAQVLHEAYGDIMRSNGTVTAHPKEDPFGWAFFARDQNDKEVTTYVPEEGSLRVSLSWIFAMPEVPANPREIQNKARADELKFEYVTTHLMRARAFRFGAWDPMVNLPPSKVLIGGTADRYAQIIFGGSRAVRLPDDRIGLFRPGRHIQRFNNNARKIKLPNMTEEDLLDTFETVAVGNLAYLPPVGMGGLYLAPGMRPTEEQIGVAPGTKYLFTCYGIPVDKIYKKRFKIKIDTDFFRAAPGGTGDHKYAGNYAGTFERKAIAQEEGFDDCVFLNVTDRSIGEATSSNVFFIEESYDQKGNPKRILRTPPLKGLILPGITRDSILAMGPELIAAKLIDAVEVEPIWPSKLANMQAAFLCGTGVTVQAMKSISYWGKDYPLNMDDPVAKKISEIFSRILRGEEIGKAGSPYANWLHVVDEEAVKKRARRAA